jgi:hypothetical protein
LGVAAELATSGVSGFVGGQIEDLEHDVVGRKDPRVVVTLRSW